jgi:microcin C transport system permease protein
VTEDLNTASDSSYIGARGLPPEFIEELEKQFGFDKPPLQRFLTMVWNYARFDFGESYFRSIGVIDLIKEKLPVSITLGLWSTLIAYAISIPLGIRKAVKDGTSFDTWTSGVIIAAYAIPGFLFAILLLVLFAGGSYYQIFPLRGLTSDNFDELSAIGKVLDYFWHIALPVLASTIGAFATLTLLTKNSFLDEIKKLYVVTARAKGLSESQVLYGHVFRNAMLIVIAGFPAVFVSVFFGGSVIIETIFSLDGLGRLGYEAAVARDYPIVFGTLYIFGLMGLVVAIISDLMYVLVDPRIDFEKREG